MSTHEPYMNRCLELAIKGLGSVAPNPMVGCVVVRNNQIIGEGYHQEFGKSHAEVNAIQSVKDTEFLKESSLYVNLEPCSHFGKTPPCTDLILRMEIPRVIIGSIDPNPLVSGRGIEKLRDNGVEVETGVLKAEADFLNRRFITLHKQKRPYIILKWAESADGFMALNEPKPFWFSADESRKLTHKWRSEEQAILVGRKTVEIDDPELTVRYWTGRNPIRVVIDPTLKLNHRYKIFNGEAETLIFNQVRTLEEGSNKFVRIDFGGKEPAQMLEYLAKNSIASLLVEGGAETLNRFIEKGLWDEARVFSSRHIVKEGKKAPSLSGKIIEEAEIETDRLKVFVNSSWST